MKRPNRYRGKRRTEVASEEQLAYVGETDARKNYRKRSGSQTVRTLSVNQVNVNMKGGKTVRATVKNVVGNDADPNYIRRNIVTCLLYTSPSPRDKRQSRMPSSA